MQPDNSVTPATEELVTHCKQWITRDIERRDGDASEVELNFLSVIAAYDAQRADLSRMRREIVAAEQRAERAEKELDHHIKQLSKTQFENMKRRERADAAMEKVTTNEDPSINSG